MEEGCGGRGCGGRGVLGGRVGVCDSDLGGGRRGGEDGGRGKRGRGKGGRGKGKGELCVCVCVCVCVRSREKRGKGDVCVCDQESKRGKRERRGERKGVSRGGERQAPLQGKTREDMQGSQSHARSHTSVSHPASSVHPTQSFFLNYNLHLNFIRHRSQRPPFQQAPLPPHPSPLPLSTTSAWGCCKLTPTHYSAKTACWDRIGS